MVFLFRNILSLRHGGEKSSQIYARRINCSPCKTYKLLKYGQLKSKLPIFTFRIIFFSYICRKFINNAFNWIVIGCFCWLGGAGLAPHSLRIRSAKQKIILPLFPFMLIHSTNRLCNIQSKIYLWKNSFLLSPARGANKHF